MCDRPGLTILQRWLKVGVLTFLLLLLSFSDLAPAWAVNSTRLPAGNAVTDGRALLRYSLPIDNSTIRDIQTSLEDIANQLRGKRWKPISKDISKATKLLTDRQTAILQSIPQDRHPAALETIATLQVTLASLQTAVEAKDKEQVWEKRADVLNLVGQLESNMVAGFPFEVPAEYSHLPQLKGRATVQMTTNKGDLTVVLDGYSAPVTAGNFVDLVQRGFYDGLPFIRAEDSYVLQVGDPPGKDNGFIDPATGKYRSVPLEILAEGDPAPTYGITLEDAGRYKDQPVLPFSSYGAVALARPNEDANGGSSQFFFFLFEAELTPAGRNLLDGRYAVFGYTVEGKDVLDKLKAGDRIESAKVIEGAENLVQPQAA